MDFEVCSLHFPKVFFGGDLIRSLGAALSRAQYEISTALV